MKIRKVWCVMLLLVLSCVASAQERPYNETTVTVVTGIKVMDGQYQNYMKYLATTWRTTMAASKEAGVVLQYDVFKANPRRPEDADLYLVTTYPNMAALDGMDAKMDAINAKTMKMTLAQREEAAGKRTVMRTVLGSEILRHVDFK